MSDHGHSLIYSVYSGQYTLGLKGVKLSVHIFEISGSAFPERESKSHDAVCLYCL